ncbi:MAG TPA: hypothetical protein VGD43_00550 [Micromonospora sp.]
MDVAQDGGRLAASLAGRLGQVAFAGLTAGQVTERIIDAVADWGGGEGWRVYRRARSVVTLPPPLSRQHSVIDVACARPDGPPVVIEVDSTDRRRTLDKLLAEADAGRIALWVRWGTGRFVAPPPPVHLVTCPVTRHNGPSGQGRLYARWTAGDRPPPPHSFDSVDVGSAVALPIPDVDPEAS